MRRFRDFCYGQRWEAETVMSMIKRRLGAAVSGRSDASRSRDVILKVIAHNLMLVVSCLAEPFYRALLSPFLFPAGMCQRQSGPGAVPDDALVAGA